MVSNLTGGRVTFFEVLRVREFRILWIADAQSAIGDQIARVALSALVFERTSSAILTALTYALTFVPALLGGVLLSGLADRLPRRRVMIGCDVIRAVLLALMAVPGTPIWLICLLLVIAVLTESPFVAAESSMMPTILADEQYVVGTALRTITYQIAQLAGFAGGGIVIAVIGARTGLVVDAATFAVSGMLIAAGVRVRPATATPDSTGGSAHGIRGSLMAGMNLVFRDRRLRTLLGLAWLAGVFVVPEGIAAPYAHAIGGGTSAQGLLMAAMPAGTSVGTYLFVRLAPAGMRSRLMGPLAIAGGVPLIACWMLPGLALSLCLWAASGLFFCYQVQVITEFTRAVPDEQRGQAVGIASSGLLAVQGIGILLGGIVAGTWGVGRSVGLAGLVGSLLGCCLTLMWARASVKPAPLPPAEAGQHRRPA